MTSKFTKPRVVGAVAQGTAEAQNAEFFGTDLTPIVDANHEALFRIFLAFSAAVDLEYTLNSGTTWVLVNTGTDLVASAGYIFYIAVRNGDTVNFRIPTVGGATVSHFRVAEILEEG